MSALVASLLKVAVSTGIAELFKSYRTKANASAGCDPSWLMLAYSELGQKEIPGRVNNLRIVEYIKTTRLPAWKHRDETPWCSAFVNFCLLETGFPVTSSALARSWTDYGKTLLDPERGCLVVLRRGKKAWQGHVGFFLREDKKNVWIIGGNQGNRVSVKRFPKSAVLSYRWPPGA